MLQKTNYGNKSKSQNSHTVVSSKFSFLNVSTFQNFILNPFTNRPSLK